MSNEIFIPKERSANALAAEAVTTGSLIVTPDTAELYADLSGGRVKISDVIELATDAERTALLAPLNKFYFVRATGKLWRWDGSGWVNLSPDCLQLDGGTVTGTAIFNSDIHGRRNMVISGMMINRSGATGSGLIMSGGNIVLSGGSLVATTGAIIASGGIVGNLSGNAATASKLATVRKLSFSGAATGSVSIDGSADVSCALTLAAHTHTYVDIVGAGTLSAGADLNDYVTPGDYLVNAVTLVNAPTSYFPGRLEVRTRNNTANASGWNNVYQRISNKSGKTYTRVKNDDGTWTAWEMVIMSGNLATASAPGLMSAADKTKLDGLSGSAEACSLFGTGITPPELLGKYTKQVDGSYVNAASAGNGGYVIRLNATSDTWEIYSTEFASVLWTTAASVDHPWQVDAWVADPSSFAAGTPMIIQL